MMRSTIFTSMVLVLGIAIPTAASAQTLAPGIVSCDDDKAKERHMKESDDAILKVIAKSGASVSTSGLRQGRKLFGIPFINMKTGYFLDRTSGIAHLDVQTISAAPLQTVAVTAGGSASVLANPVATSTYRCDTTPGAVITTTCYTTTTYAFPLPEQTLAAAARPDASVTMVVNGTGQRKCSLPAYAREFRLFAQAAGQ